MRQPRQKALEGERKRLATSMICLLAFWFNDLNFFYLSLSWFNCFNIFWKTFHNFFIRLLKHVECGPIRLTFFSTERARGGKGGAEASLVWESREIRVISKTKRFNYLHSLSFLVLAVVINAELTCFTQRDMKVFVVSCLGNKPMAPSL